MVLMLSTVTPALGAGRQDKERAARKACLNGDFAKGIDILSDLFVDTQNPTYIYNQGRCLEQNHRYKEAIERFREFLRTGETLKLKPSSLVRTMDCFCASGLTRNGAGGISASACHQPSFVGLF